MKELKQRDLTELLRTNNGLSDIKLSYFILGLMTGTFLTYYLIR
jgi:hypothetical protein